MTRFQVILPVGNHNVTKNLTGQRMHVAGSEIYQMNRHINSFQNMCDILEAKIDCLASRAARIVAALQRGCEEMERE